MDMITSTWGVIVFWIVGLSMVGVLLLTSIRRRKDQNRPKSAKYSHSPLDDRLAINILRDLNLLMEEQRVYLDPDLSLDKLANQLGFSRHLISQVLNTKLKKSFNLYVNEYRVQHALRLMNSSVDSDNIKTIMYASGFNNRASFNNNLKKILGMTATQYLKTKQLSEAE